MEETTFWNVTEKGKVVIDWLSYMNWINDNGFRIMKLSEDNYVYIRKHNNRLVVTDAVAISKFVVDYILESNEIDVYQYIMNNVNKFLGKKVFTLIKGMDLDLSITNRDTSDTMFFYFKNCYLEITKDNILKKRYDTLEKPIWEDQVIQRNFSDFSTSTSVFKKFIKNVSGANIQRVMSYIGYLLNTQKESSNAKCVILYDKDVEDGISDGGTGKSLIGKAIKEIRNVKEINGKSFDTADKFKYQGVNFNNSVVFINDVVKEGFDLEVLFNDITDDLVIERKYKTAFSVPFKYSPKFLLTTNGITNGLGFSYERRVLEFGVNNHYTKGKTPRDEFGKDFFDWNDDEWSDFYCFMIECAQLFLEKGTFKNDADILKAKRLENVISLELMGWLDESIECDNKYEVQYAMFDFKDSIYAKDVKHLQNLSQRKFNSRVMMYAEYMGWECKKIKSNSKTYFTFTKKNREEHNGQIINDERTEEESGQCETMSRLPEFLTEGSETFCEEDELQIFQN